ARLVAASRTARQLGVRPGMTLAQARGIAPDLIARGRDPSCEGSAHEALLEVAGGLSPRVEDTAHDLAFADVAGMGRLFPGTDGQAEMAHRAMRTAAALDLPVRVGIAGCKLAARVAARRPTSPTIVPPGEETGFLAPLPLHALELEPRLGRTLRRWGLVTIGDLARLPAAEIARRLGADGEAAHRAARGEDPSPLVPYHPPLAPSEGFELEWPVLTLEPLLLTVGELVGRLMERLRCQGLACLRLEVDLDLEPEGHDRRVIRLPAPTTEVKALMGILGLELEVRLPGAPVATVRCTAHPDRPRRAQLTLFGPPEISPARLATTIARAMARIGPDRVGSPRLADSYLPEAVSLAVFEPPPPPKERRASREGRGLLAVRTLRPPVPLEVITEVRGTSCAVEAGGRARVEPLSQNVASGHQPPTPDVSERDNRCPVQGTEPPCPVSLRSETGARLHIQGLVRVAAGPWRCEEGWWSDSPADRDYWDIELSDGRLYRLYRNCRDGTWYADGVYD
ncbi:MAG: DNA polymerase Y family protein, partial [Acidobacteria bacterium]|nr:DNA polymerase Y family protein [Acidobacteriota bacterium]